MKSLSVNELIEFENDIADCFNQAKIKAPVHLQHGNEEQIIKIFQDFNIGHDDWVFGTWRSHYHCLLKGVPQEDLKNAILKCRSISLCFKDYKIFCSGIVTGTLSIAVGTALSIKRQGLNHKVYCFCGDMTSMTGAFHECLVYARNHQLPIRFVIEDNGQSVCTDTRKTWNTNILTYENVNDDYVTYYRYSLKKYPHAGAGSRVQF